MKKLWKPKLVAKLWVYLTYDVDGLFVTATNGGPTKAVWLVPGTGAAT